MSEKKSRVIGEDMVFTEVGIPAPPTQEVSIPQPAQEEPGILQTRLELDVDDNWILPEDEMEEMRQEELEREAELLLDEEIETVRQRENLATTEDLPFTTDWMVVGGNSGTVVPQPPTQENNEQGHGNRIAGIEEAMARAVRNATRQMPRFPDTEIRTESVNLDRYDVVKGRPVKKKVEEPINEEEEAIILIAELADFYALEELKKEIKDFDLQKHEKAYNKAFKKHFETIKSYKRSKDGK